MHNGDKGELSEDLWQVFCADDRKLYDGESQRTMAGSLQEVRSGLSQFSKILGVAPVYKACLFTYLNYEVRIQ